VEYALLYTFSTIPQTVGAAFGLLAAFVLYRLQWLDRELWEQTNYLVGDWLSQELKAELGALRSRRRYRKFQHALAGAIEEYRRRMARQNVVSEDLTPWSDGKTRLENLEWAVAASEAVRTATWRALWPTALTIVCSTAAIPFAHVICGSFSLSWCFILIDLLLLTACLVTYMMLIRSAIGAFGGRPPG
jgi:hypothetical protein